MRTIHVTLVNGVFVPQEQVDVSDGQEAIVILSPPKPTAIPDNSDLKKQAENYFMQEFPGLEIDQSALELVGIALQPDGESWRQEYNNGLERKYND